VVQAAYIEAGDQFHRAVVEAPEPDRENLVVTLKPAKFFSVSAGRQNFLTPLGDSQNNVRSSIDQATASLNIAGVALLASFYHSTYLGNSNNSTAYTAGRDFTSRLHATASYLESRPNNGAKTRSFIANFTEVLTPPGYHELTMQSGEMSPTASFKAAAGKEYFFQLDYEHVVPSTSLRDLSVTLSMEPKMTGADERREVTIDPSNLLAILAQSNPDGLEPSDPILTDANATDLLAVK
jgi:hypothetical protein